VKKDNHPTAKDSRKLMWIFWLLSGAICPGKAEVGRSSSEEVGETPPRPGFLFLY